MVEKLVFILAHAEARRRAADCVENAPEGWTVTIAPQRRGADINAALHARLGEISASHEWAGKKHDIETWKRLLVAAWGRETGDGMMMLPALDGSGVDVVYRHTSKMTQREVSDLLSYIEAWCSETEKA